MPFVGLNMATPVENMGASQIYLIPDPETTRTNEKNNRELKVIVIKFFQLVICGAALLGFVLSSDASISSARDMITATIMGMYLMYPLMVLCGGLRIGYHKLVFFNVIATLALFSLGLLGIVHWWSMEFDMEELSEYEIDPEQYESIKYGANMKIFSATFNILNSVLYLIDTGIMLLHIMGFKI